jgi:hypothetical protein
MRLRLIRSVLLALPLVWLTGCADQVVALRYAPDPAIQKLAGSQTLTVFRFVDARGDEGDHGDPMRVGGTYGGYGNRLSKVNASTPWPEALVHGLSDGLAQRGVRTVSVPDRVYAPGGAPVSTALILCGEIRNFSTEQRWTLQSHISGNVRLYDQRGALLLEKRISTRTSIMDADSKASGSSVPLETLLNETLQKFVRAVVMDPEVTQRLSLAPGSGRTTSSIAEPGSASTSSAATQGIDLSDSFGPGWGNTTLSISQPAFLLAPPTASLVGSGHRPSLGRSASGAPAR